jgi:hypothetical protein
MRAQCPYEPAVDCVEHCTSVPLCTMPPLQPLLRHPDLCPSVAVISCPADDRGRRESSQIVRMLVLVTGGTTEAVVRQALGRPGKLSGVHNAWGIDRLHSLHCSLSQQFASIGTPASLLLLGVQRTLLLRLLMSGFDDRLRLRSGKDLCTKVRSR